MPHAVPMQIQCEGFRCLAYQNENGDWINFHNHQPIQVSTKKLRTPVAPRYQPDLSLTGVGARNTKTEQKLAPDDTTNVTARLETALEATHS